LITFPLCNETIISILPLRIVRAFVASKPVHAAGIVGAEDIGVQTWPEDF
jgi:hypothetical protein